MLTLEKTHTTCPQEEHDQCGCALPKVLEQDGMFVYAPYIFDVTEQVFADLCK